MAGHAVPSRMLERVLVQHPKRLILEVNFLHVTYQLIQALARLTNKGPVLGLFAVLEIHQFLPNTRAQLDEVDVIPSRRLSLAWTENLPKPTCE